MANNYVKISEAADLAGVTDVQYLHKLVKKGELPARYELRGKMKYWFVDISSPRFKKLLKREGAPKQITRRKALTYLFDWEEWEAMCRTGEVLTTRRCSEDTIAGYKYRITKFFKQYNYFDRDTLRKALNEYELKVTLQNDYFASRQWTYRAMVTVAKYYIYKGYREPGFLADIAQIKPKKRVSHSKRHCHTPDVLDKAFASLKEITQKNFRAYSPYNEILISTFINLAFQTGARNGELCRIRLNDIDWHKGPFGSITLHGKGGKIRVVGITEDLKLCIEEYLKARPKTVCEYLLVWQIADKVGPMHPRLFARRLSTLAKRMEGVERFHPHSLRHSAITNFFRLGLPAAYIRDIAGHADLSTTNIYAQPNENDIVEAMGNLKRCK